MQVISLTLDGFRNYGLKRFDFSDGVNLIYGDNGVGKTNLLEAMFIFASGKSFRGIKDREMIGFTRDNAFVRLEFETGGVKNILEAKLYKNKKRELFKNSALVSRLSEYLGLFRAVVFTPDHLNLIKGSPENRRRFLDIAMCQSFPRYVGLLSDYNRVLSQKSTLLKSEITDRILLELYNEQLSGIGASITKSRYAFLCRLEKYSQAVYSEMTSQKETLSVGYESQVSEKEDVRKIKDEYSTLFEKKSETEIYRRACLYGTHKDDFTVGIQDHTARYFASQGQQRSAVLALKLAEGQLYKSYTGEECVYLLDDILSELDDGRKSFVLKKLGGKQFIVTACDDINLGNGYKKIKIEK